MEPKGSRRAPSGRHRLGRGARVTGQHKEEGARAGKVTRGSDGGSGWPRPSGPHACWGGSHKLCPEGIPGLRSGTVILGAI